MPRMFRLTAFLLVAILVTAAAWAQSNRKPPSKRPPRRWDKRVLDVFFDDIKSAVGPGQPGAAPRVAANNSETTTNSGTSDDGATDGFAWSSVISAETLEDEIKSITLDLETAVENPGRFKSGRNNDARRLFSVAAVMLTVIHEYDADVRFKDKAAGLRVGAARAGMNSKAATDATFNEARDRFRELQDIVRGASVDLPTPDEPPTYSELAEYAPLMQRMEQGFQQVLRPGTSNADEFRSRKSDLIHESQLMAVFARFIRDGSHGYTPDETFESLSHELESQSLALAAAANSDDLKAAQAAAGAIDQSCGKCHDDYR